MAESIIEIAEKIRSRILRGLEAGTLTGGDRLASARELVDEFAVDYRQIISAYRSLADEGLIDIRPRGGVYVRDSLSEDPTAAAVHSKWLVDTFAEGFSRGIEAPKISELISSALESLRIRALVITSTDDQAAGLARELENWFGLEAEGFATPGFKTRRPVDSIVQRANLLISTEAHSDAVEVLASDFGKAHIRIDVRPDLAVGDWAMLLRKPVWAIVATQEFGDLMRQFFVSVPSVENLHVLVYGRDDLNQIPDGAATYITHRVRESVDITKIPGRILQNARTVSPDSARKIFEFVVQANVRALQALNDHVGAYNGKLL